MSSINLTAILVAAGRGERLSDFTEGIPKQFAPLNKAPLFMWALTTLAMHPAIEKILIPVPKNWLARSAELIADFLPSLQHKISLIPGGDTRQESVHIALEALSTSGSQPTDIIIHDAVRPFITNKILAQILEELEKSNAITLGIPLSDSIKEIDHGSMGEHRVYQDLDRNKFILVQTPQAAKFSLILEAHRQAKLNKNQSTDDASIIKAYGGSITVISGNKLNFKITEPEDLIIAQALTKYHNWSLGNIVILD